MRLLLALALGASVGQPVRPGVWHQEVPMANAGALSSVRAHVVMLDPRSLHFSLEDPTRDSEGSGTWTIDRMDASDVVAFNAGQFSAAGAWGWVVRDGVEVQAPGSGSVAMAFAIDEAGVPVLLEPAEIQARRGHVTLAFQSYPALLVGTGALPRELEAPGRGVNLTHRDSRLAIGIRGDGKIVVALTRFTGFGSGGQTLPWGPTAPEMAAFMKSLGCERAMLLDGGVSGQLAVRAADGTLRRWPNWRAVPLAMVAR